MTSPGTQPADVGWRELICWIARRRRRFRVEGRSMWPTLKPGDEVLIAPHVPIKAGDLVVARHPFRTDTVVVKRLERIDIAGAFLVGDNPAESTDSSALGAISLDLILGPVTSCYRSGQRHDPPS